MSEARGESVLAVGVVGGGLVSQAMHLPHLSELRRFHLAALADPSAAVRSSLGPRYGIDKTYADWRELLGSEELDALVVATPVAAHVEIVLAALAHGLHVFCEKPLAIDVADIDRIIAARTAAKRVVQVGYMKRYDPAYERLLEELPSSDNELRYVSVVVNDPEAVPFFRDGDLVRGDDLSSELIAAGQAAQNTQLESAIGAYDRHAVAAYLDGFLGSLVHDVNLVHGVLEALGQSVPPQVVSGHVWAEGRAVSGAAELVGRARWDSAWIQLVDTREYREAVSFFFSDSIRRLTFPSPWLRMSPTLYERGGSVGLANTVTRFESFDESFRRELEHFHACCLGEAECRTPPEQARQDTVLLAGMFRAASEAGARSDARRASG